MRLKIVHISALRVKHLSQAIPKILILSPFIIFQKLICETPVNEEEDNRRHITLDNVEPDAFRVLCSWLIRDKDEIG